MAGSSFPNVMPSRKEGAGKAGCRLHPQPHAQGKKAHELVTTGSPESAGFPCAVVLTACFVLAPETGLCCLRPLRDAKHHRKVDISVGISGPHDFAVHISAVRQRVAESVHRIPRPTSVTIAIRPSSRARDGRKNASDLPDAASENLCGRLTRRANQGSPT